MKPIIEVNHISKKYKYGESKPYYTLRESLADFTKHPFGAEKTNAGLKRNEFWALKDISFKVDQGEAIGIIGPNGSGKSTLLKILSQITTPTSGEAILRGRVGSLLEVGTGFHQELTGRENIYLNGAILGMTRREINRKFDKIVDFSGVEKFLDTPVKHYSSGMYMRLAFAVAAHLDSEILLVDEVLAVGDAEFQKKCLGKMGEITNEEGRTIIFVSHNLQAVQNLCNRCLLVSEGSIQKEGNTSQVVNLYVRKQIHERLAPLATRRDRKGNGKVQITELIVKNNLGKNTNSIISGETGEITIGYKILDNNIKLADLSLGINSKETGNRVMFISSKVLPKKIIVSKDKKTKIILKNIPLYAGEYSLTVFLESNGEILDWIEDAFVFKVVNSNKFSDRSLVPKGQGDTVLEYEIDQS